MDPVARLAEMVRESRSATGDDAKRRERKGEDLRGEIMYKVAREKGVKFPTFR